MTYASTVEQADALGYCIISRKFHLASRIDRIDWKEYMAKQHSPWSLEDGLAWTRHFSDVELADHYRRVVSNDTITVPWAWAKKLKKSGEGYTEFKS